MVVPNELLFVILQFDSNPTYLCEQFEYLCVHKINFK
jgi:hypothetical protein